VVSAGEGAGDESEGGTLGRADQEAAGDETEPGRSGREETDEQSNERAGPGSGCSPRQDGALGGHFPGDPFNGSQIGADDLQFVDREVSSGQAVDGIAGVMVWAKLATVFQLLTARVLSLFSAVLGMKGMVFFQVGSRGPRMRGEWTAAGRPFRGERRPAGGPEFCA
jgi:hypothetical protein